MRTARARYLGGLTLAAWLVVGCGGTEIGTAPIRTETGTTDLRTPTTRVELRTLPPMRLGVGQPTTPLVLLPGRYQTTVFEPPFRFSVEGSWLAQGESSSAIAIGRRSPVEAQCEFRNPTGRALCFDVVSLYGVEIVDRFDLVEVLRDHPEVVRGPSDEEIDGRQAAALELFISYESTPDALAITGQPLPREEFPDLMWSYMSWWAYGGVGPLRFIQVDEIGLIVLIASPTREGFDLFEPEAQTILDSIEFLEGQ